MSRWASGLLKQARHAFVEVAAAITVEDCGGSSTRVSARKRHCVMLENCCYGENECSCSIWRDGGVRHAHAWQCGYIHDCANVLFELGSEGDWRRDYHWQMDGNLYPYAMALGPSHNFSAFGRGDRFKFLVSTSRSSGPHRASRRGEPNGGRHGGRKNTSAATMNTSILQVRSWAAR